MEQEIPLLMAVMLQVMSVAVLALGAALVAGWSSAASVMLGGGAAIVPNSLFAMRLALQRGRSAESYPVVFFLGQFAKIGLTVGLLGAIAKWLGSEVQWLPLLLGLIVALKAPLFALLYVRSQPDPAPAARVEGGSAAVTSRQQAAARCTAAVQVTAVERHQSVVKRLPHRSMRTREVDNKLTRRSTTTDGD